ncbi:Hypothetical protein D9617_50g044330 [Elsinoe fawcettii]|nr:Hypothetical protein D9617_50g044330 [Elsinoe fawcettii]
MDIFNISNATAMILSNLVVYLLPIWILWHVQLSRKNRLNLNIILLLGFLVLGASCLRLVAVLRVANGRQSLKNAQMAMIWGAVENHVAIFLACLPAIKAAIADLLFSALPITATEHGDMMSNAIGTTKMSLQNHSQGQLVPSEKLPPYEVQAEEHLGHEVSLASLDVGSQVTFFKIAYPFQYRVCLMGGHTTKPSTLGEIPDYGIVVTREVQVSARDDPHSMPTYSSGRDDFASKALPALPTTN